MLNDCLKWCVRVKLSAQYTKELDWYRKYRRENKLNTRIEIFLIWIKPNKKNVKLNRPFKLYVFVRVFFSVLFWFVLQSIADLLVFFALQLFSFQFISIASLFSRSAIVSVCAHYSFNYYTWFHELTLRWQYHFHCKKQRSGTNRYNFARFFPRLISICCLCVCVSAICTNQANEPSQNIIPMIRNEFFFVSIILFARENSGPQGVCVCLFSSQNTKIPYTHTLNRPVCVLDVFLFAAVIGFCFISF